MTEVGLPLPQYTFFFGGALRLVEKHLGSAPSLTILIRGSAGVGKSILATDLATQIAEKLDSDVAYACLELLPTELKAQHESLYASHSFRVVTPGEQLEGAGRSIRAAAIELGPRDQLDAVREKFESSLVEFIETVRATDVRVTRVVVIDSVSPDYGLGGANVPRDIPDSVAKYAAGEGLVVVVVEEAYDERPTPWSFACDVVVEIGDRGTERGTRPIRLSKNRFGPTTRDFGEYRIRPRLGPSIDPPLSAYQNVPYEFVEGSPDDSEWSASLRGNVRLPPRRSSPLVFVEYPAGSRDGGRRIVSSIALGTSSRTVVFVDFGVVTRMHWIEKSEDSLLEWSTSRTPRRAIRTTLGPMDSAAIPIVDVIRGMVSSRRCDGSPGVAAIVVDVQADNDLVTSETLKAIDPIARLAGALQVPFVCSCQEVDASRFEFVTTLRRWADAWVSIGPPGENPMTYGSSIRVGDQVVQTSLRDPIGLEDA